MSRLFNLAKSAGRTVRGIISQAVTGRPPETETGPYIRQTIGRRSFRPVAAQDFARAVARRLAELVFRQRQREEQREERAPDWRPGAPPIQIREWPSPPPQITYPSRPTAAPPPPGPPPPAPPSPAAPPPPEPEKPRGLFGRGAAYDPQQFAEMMDAMRLTPGSTNVYGYFFEPESRTRGILYVTFLGVTSSGGRSGPGQTYAYYDVPVRKYHDFSRASAQSAGGAVWDYLRVRGSVWSHQHTYRLIQSHGDYVPRKATAAGFKTRTVARMGGEGPFRQAEFTPVGERARAIRRSYTRSTLPERLFAQPNRGEPDRGEPNRGR